MDEQRWTDERIEDDLSHRRLYEGSETTTIADACWLAKRIRDDYEAALDAAIAAVETWPEGDDGTRWEPVPNWEPVYCECGCMGMIENHPAGIQTTRDDGKRTGIQLDATQYRLMRRVTPQPSTGEKP